MFSIVRMSNDELINFDKFYKDHYNRKRNEIENSQHITPSRHTRPSHPLPSRHPRRASYLTTVTAIYLDIPANLTSFQGDRAMVEPVCPSASFPRGHYRGAEKSASSSAGESTKNSRSSAGAPPPPPPTLFTSHKARERFHA